MFKYSRGKGFQRALDAGVVSITLAMCSRMLWSASRGVMELSESRVAQLVKTSIGQRLLSVRCCSKVMPMPSPASVAKLVKKAGAIGEGLLTGESQYHWSGEVVK